MWQKPPNAHGMLWENTVIYHSVLFGTVSEWMGAKQSRLWISKPLHRTSFWSESKTPADFWCHYVSAFLFCRLQLNDRLNGILRQGFPYGNERNNAAEKTGAGTTFRENGGEKDDVHNRNEHRIVTPQSQSTAWRRVDWLRAYRPTTLQRRVKHKNGDDIFEQRNQ